MDHRVRTESRQLATSVYRAATSQLIEQTVDETQERLEQALEVEAAAPFTLNEKCMMDYRGHFRAALNVALCALDKTQAKDAASMSERDKVAAQQVSQAIPAVQCHLWGSLCHDERCRSGT